ncbi:MAG: hypothetical protein FJW32_24950 [Acidobacteria bacterium]|nr:hypothetical protein [Acidobacteriota bacterium]
MQPAPPAKNSWILSPAWDIALFIASPLAAIVTLIPLAGYFPSADFGAFLLAFFTFGHHLPGFLRAYGDADLRRRRRIAFFAAPPIIFAAAYGLAAVDLHGLLFVVFTWDIWHVLMQQYGFLRIYDSKIGAIDRLTAWGDRAVSLSWYVTFIALSPHYTHDLLLRGYSTGLPAVSPSFLQSVRAALLGVSVVLSAAYLIRQCSLWKRGTPVSWKKLLALVCFLCATWFLYVAYPDFVVGFAVWSAFHCVQYYGIVWAFNQQRAAKPDAGALVRFLFRPRIGLVLLYGALILGYGAINWSQRYLSGGTLLTLLTAFVVTSGTLHYYFDGFI